MIFKSENQFRDYLFEHHKDDLSKLIVGRRGAIEWVEEGFPSIKFLLQRRAEKKINRIVDGLVDLVLAAKELKLDAGLPNPTRVDLFGFSECNGIAIIELKKNTQTARQAFTELLAYGNYFCSIFPGMNESGITSILVSPMDSRTVRDAYAQELVFNSKNILALTHDVNSADCALNVFYPEASYYATFEDNLLNDASIACLTLEFPLIKGCIESDLFSDKGELPERTKTALNTVANAIAQRLESEGFHSVVYATQKRGEHLSSFSNPNTIIVASINPFSSYRTALVRGEFFGHSEESRIRQVQAIHNQLTSFGKQHTWLDSMEDNFFSRLIYSTKDQFKHCFQSIEGDPIPSEINCRDWFELKTNMYDSGYTHIQEIYMTGLLRETYLEYISHVYKKGGDDLFYHDDLPKYSYQMITSFLAAWEIFAGLGEPGRE